MRVPVTVSVEPFDLEKVQPRIDAIRKSFVRYLKEVPRKSSRSKYGLMGPVGKILGEARSGRHDPASLKGYAVRVHEAAGRQPSQTALDALEQGINELVRLLADTPVTAHDRIFDRLDYGLYFDLRKEALLSKESLRKEWIRFLRNKYDSEAELSQVWGEEVTSFDELYLPRKSDGSRDKKATVKQKDIAAFWELQKSSEASVDEEDE